MLVLSNMQPVMAQAKFKDIYPQPSEFKRKYKSNDYESNNGLGKNIETCLSGNCNAGAGKKLTGKWKVSSNLVNVLLDIDIYEGTFAENGTAFIGECYKVSIPFLSKDEIVTPLININLENKATLINYLDKSGKMKLEQGKATVIDGTGSAIFLKQWYPYLIKAVSRIKKGETVHVDMKFNDSSMIKSYSGKLGDNRAPFFGTVKYKDGSKYEGFLFQFLNFGPGILTKANGESVQGVWSNNNLISETSVGSLKKFLDTSAIMFRSQTDYSGKFTTAPSDGWGMVETNNYIYYGLWKDGKLDGVGTAVPIKNPYIKSDAPNWFGGLYKEGKIQFGVKAWTGSRGFRFQEEGSWFLNTGKFSYDNNYGFVLDTCGEQLRYVKSPYIFKLEEVKGMFSTDDPRWWCIVKDLSNPFTPKELVFIYIGTTYNKISGKVEEGAYNSMTTGHYPCFIPDPVAKDNLLAYWAQRVEKSSTSRYVPPKPVATPEHPCPGSQNSKIFPRGTWQTSGNTDFIVIGYECSTDKIICLKRNYTEGRNTFFKTDANIGFYNVEIVHLTTQELVSKSPRSEKVNICNVCTGTGIVREEVIHGRGGKWQDISSVISVYTPYHEIARWTERAKCPKCNHRGVLTK